MQAAMAPADFGARVFLDGTDVSYCHHGLIG